MEEELELSFALRDELYWIKRTVSHAKDFKDLGLDPYDPEFANNLRDAMERAKAIHFNIYYMVINRVLTEPAGLNLAGSTNWELRTIWDTPELLAKTTFYRNGKMIRKEDIAQLP